MTRGVASATATELATKNFNIVNLLEFQGIGGTDTHLTDAPVDISYNDGGGADTYLSTRGMLGVSDITEENEIKIETVDISNVNTVAVTVPVLGLYVRLPSISKPRRSLSLRASAVHSASTRSARTRERRRASSPENPRASRICARFTSICGISSP